MFKYLVLFGILSLSTQLVAQDFRSNVDRRQEWAKLKGVLLRNDVVHCSTLRNQGRTFGEYMYRQVAPDCGSLYTRAQAMAKDLNDVRVFFPLAKQDFNQACYQSGWLLGYLNAHENLFPKCESQLKEIDRVNLQNRITECRAIGEAVKDDSESLGNFMRSLLAPGETFPDELEKDMLVLVAIGRSGEAWDLALNRQKAEIYSTLPCNIAIAKTLIEAQAASNEEAQP